MNQRYPDPEQIEHDRTVVFMRRRIVVQAYDEEQAVILAEKISEFSACNIETFQAITDKNCSHVFGEIVLGRELVPVKDQVAVDICR